MLRCNRSQACAASVHAVAEAGVAMMSHPVPAHTPQRSSRLKLGTVRTAFAVGGRLMPQRTVRQAARLFSTPFASSRIRAQAALADGSMRRGDMLIDGRRIATYLWGDPYSQPYALMAHGWSSFGLRFQPWVPYLRAMGLAVVAFDQPGHGLSDGRYCTLPDFVDTASAVGQRFGPAALAVGHSLGAAAVVLAQDLAWRADRLILLAPAADMAAATDRFFRLVRLGVHLRTPFFEWHRQQTGISPQDLQVHRHLPALGQPGLVVHDMDDCDVPWAEGERCVRHWRDARLLTTQGLGHHHVVDAPEVIGAALAFIGGEEIGERVIGSPNLPFGL
jgi:pimeloyl-ACP methyl ester carboxylesterase